MTTIQTSARGNVSPKDGGCWFCHKDSGQMNYSSEVKSNFHKDCLKYELKVNPDNEDANFILSEIMDLHPNEREASKPSTGEQIAFDLNDEVPNLTLESVAGQGMSYRIASEGRH